MNSPKYIIFHTSDVPKSNKYQFYQINDYHRDIRRFPKSSTGFYGGYHILINGGKEYRYRSDLEEGAHCNDIVNGQSMNFQSLGVAIGFDGDFEFPDTPDIDLLRTRIKTWQKLYSIPDENIRYHRHFNQYKTCPGSLISDDWLQRILNPEPKPNAETVKQTLLETYNLTLINLLRQLILELQKKINQYKGR